MNYFASNPFCTRIVRPGAIEYTFDQQGDLGDDVDGLLSRICNTRYHLIVGPHGSGKSTLIRELVSQIENRFSKIVEIQLHDPELSPQQPFRSWLGRIFRHPIHKRQMRICVAKQQTAVTGGGLLIIDGLEQLSWFAVVAIRSRARRQGQTVLATSHQSHRGFAVLRNTTLDAGKIIALTESLIASITESEQTLVRRELDRRSLGPETNLRDLWFDLYDLIETSRRQQYARSLDRRDYPVATHS
ncbi:ABC transporter ATP-binding protein [Novipirellula sp. SH528]|uniref:ATP-binding cassette domain-containing protein n=1 Tax=Novipirellula sp. SH528 TaxID=3454466 RepID=UPI003FA18D14